MKSNMQKIIPHIWFDKDAEEAAKFYTSVFQDGKIISTTHYPEAGQEVHGMEAGTVLTINVQMEGYHFTLLNGGPHFTPNPSISFFVDRKTKEEIDELWEKLSEEGTELMPLNTYPFSPYYGWVQDKYGVSWQLMLFEEDEEIPPAMPSLLFVGENCGNADEAIDFYVSVFRNSRRGMTARYESEIGPNKKDDIAYADFELEGQKFAAMDSGLEHAFTFNEAISLMVMCEDQEEIDYYWEKLSAVPEAEQCGWLKDKYGVSWQITPRGMEEMLNNEDKEKAARTMEAMLEMKKINIADLEEAGN